MKAVTSTVTAGVTGFLLLLRVSGDCQPAPDPVALLQGVEAVRLQIPPSSLRLKFTYRDGLITNETLLTVDFDGSLRGFRVISDSPSVGHYNTVFNDEKAICYDEKNAQVSFRTLRDGTYMMLFDPRLLGISTYNAWSDEIRNELRYDIQPSRVELLGQEYFGGVPAWHVRVTGGAPAGDTGSDYWIDDKHGFRVYERDWNLVRTFSSYDDAKYAWLPSRVISREYRPSDTGGLSIFAEREFELLDAKANVSFATTRWTLAGMGVKRGTDILDYSAMRGLGVWDGRSIAPKSSVLSRRNRLGLLGYMTCITILSLPLVLWWASKRRARSQPIC